MNGQWTNRQQITDNRKHSATITFQVKKYQVMHYYATFTKLESLCF
jgi:hypothetical protein